MTHSPEVALLADDLKKLAGWGTDQKLRSLTRVCALAQVPERAGKDAAILLVRGALREGISRLTEPAYVAGCRIPPEKLRSALETLLSLTSRSRQLYAEARRRYVIEKILKVPVTLDYWRQSGPEYELVLVLAQKLLESGQEPAYLRLRREDRVTINDFGVPEFESVHTIQVLSNTLDHVRNWLTYPSDSREGAVEVIPVFGCSLNTRAWNEMWGQEQSVLELPGLTRGDVHTYAFKGRVHSTVPMIPTYYQHSPMDTQLFKLTITFHSEKLPGLVWVFEDASPFEVPGQPYKVSQPRSDGLTYVHTYHHLRRSRCYGLAWRW